MLENVERKVAECVQKDFLLMIMSAAETIVEELKSLSPGDREKAESYIHDLKEEHRRLRQDVLKRTHAAWSS